MKVQKEHRKTALMRWTKEELADHIVCLEHNYNVLYQSFDNQYHNCLKLLDDMKLVNDTYSEARKKIRTVFISRESEDTE